MKRRSCLQFVAASIATHAFGARAADAWPAKGITLVSTSPAGGNADVIGRSIAAPLSAALKVPVIVEPRPGVTGMIASAYVAKAPADGYTLLIGSIATHAIAPSLNKNLPYNVVRDFSPILMIGTNSLILAVSAKSPYRTVADILAAAKADPGSLSYASPGIGGTSHLSGELFQKLTGAKLIHVPNARNPAYADVIANNATMLFEGSVALLPHIRNGLLRPIAVTSKARSPQLPEVPTMAESGVTGFEVQSWQAVFGPGGMPQSVITRLHQELANVLLTSEVKQRLAQLDISPLELGPAALAAFQLEEIAKWATLVKSANIAAN